MAALLLTGSVFAQKTAMLKLSAPSTLEQKALDWFQDNSLGDVITLDQLESDDFTPANYNVLWVMVDRTNMAVGDSNLPDGLKLKAQKVLKNYVEQGGNLLLTNHATQLAVSIGRCPYAPGIYGSGNGDANPDEWGIQPVIGNVEGQIYDYTTHPIYNGLESNDAYGHPTFALIGDGHKFDHNCMWDLNLVDYGLTENPNKVADFEDKTNAVVLGTWQHVVDYCCAGIVEFMPTPTYTGTVLACGLAAFDWGQCDYNGNFKAFAKNMLDYLKSMTTGIVSETLKVNIEKPAGIYNLQGQCVDEGYKGITIVNGKKVKH